MTRSRLVVLTIIALAGLAIGATWLFIDEKGDQGKLAKVDCASMLETDLELQGARVPVSREETCDIIRTIAAMQPNGESNRNDESDPWHYFGRMRVRPADDVWFLVFMAHPSDNFKPIISLRHRRGLGWAIVGQFDAEPVLRKLNLLDRIDMAKLKSEAALTPTDQSTPM